MTLRMTLFPLSIVGCSGPPEAGSSLYDDMTFGFSRTKHMTVADHFLSKSAPQMGISEDQNRCECVASRSRLAFQSVIGLELVPSESVEMEVGLASVGAFDIWGEDPAARKVMKCCSGGDGDSGRRGEKRIEEKTTSPRQTMVRAWLPHKADAIRE